MNKYLAAMAAVGSVVFGAEAVGAAAVLPNHSYTMQANGIYARPLPEPLEFSFSVYNTGWIPDWASNRPESERRRVFDRLRLTESDVGKTFYVPASVIPGAIDLLTNGQNNLVYWELTTGNGGAFMEWPFLFGAAATPGPRDFAGENLTHMGLTVNELEINEPVASGYRYDFSLNIVLVPEPSGLAPLGVAGLALLRRRRGAT